MTDDEAREQRRHIIEAISAEKLEAYRLAFESGDRDALLDALAFCINTDLNPPRWVVTEFTAAWWVRYDSGQARTLDEAFGISRPKKWTQKRARKDWLTHIVWQRVIDHRKRGESIARDLFDQVAHELSDEIGVPFNGTDVQNAYYAITNITKDSR